MPRLQTTAVFMIEAEVTPADEAGTNYWARNIHPAQLCRFAGVRVARGHKIASDKPRCVALSFPYGPVATESGAVRAARDHVRHGPDGETPCSQSPHQRRH